jgi:hypothetical protein
MTFQKPYKQYEGQWVGRYDNTMALYLIKYLETYNTNADDVEHIRFLVVQFDLDRRFTDIAFKKYWIDNGGDHNKLISYFPLEDNVHDVIRAII